jgi:hypothetical protein
MGLVVRGKKRAALFVPCLLVLAFLAVSCSAGNGLKCDLCKVVAKKVANFAHNTTSLNHTIEKLQGECNTKFEKHPFEKKACDFIVEKLVGLLPFAYRELSSLAWDSANLCAVVGICKVNCCPTKTTPEQVHISLSRDPTEMQVMWTTLDDTKTHSVWWGTDEGHLNQTNAAPGASTTYTHFGWVGALHATKMEKLAPGTQYFYKVGDAAGGWSNIFSFRTFHTDAGTAGHPLRVGSVGDMGYAKNSDNTIARLSDLIDSGDLDMVVHNGDISYADGEMSHWDVFMRKIETVAARVPYQVTPGNHEMWFNFSAYKHRFTMSDEGANDNLFYGVHVGSPQGGVHFVGMDTESWYDRAHMSKEQVSWIDRELKSTKSSPRWTVAYGHRPLYCSNHGGQDIPRGNTVLRKAVEDVLVANSVDLVIQAHEHDYERTFPVYQSQAVSTNYSNPTKPIYVVNGAAGNREKNEKPPGGSESYWPPGLNRTGLISYGIFTISSNSLKWEQRISADNSLQDSFEIAKTAP